MEIEAMPRQSRLCRGKTDGDRGKAEAEAVTRGWGKAGGDRGKAEDEAVTPRPRQCRWRSRQGRGRGSHPEAEARQMETGA